MISDKKTKKIISIEKCCSTVNQNIPIPWRYLNEHVRIQVESMYMRTVYNTNTVVISLIHNYSNSIKAITRDARTQVTSIYIDATLGTVSIIGEAFINI